MSDSWSAAELRNHDDPWYSWPPYPTEHPDYTCHSTAPVARAGWHSWTVFLHDMQLAISMKGMQRASLSHRLNFSAFKRNIEVMHRLLSTSRYDVVTYPIGSNLYETTEVQHLRHLSQQVKMPWSTCIASGSRCVCWWKCCSLPCHEIAWQAKMAWNLVSCYTQPRSWMVSMDFWTFFALVFSWLWLSNHDCQDVCLHHRHLNNCMPVSAAVSGT